jgi:hypothetical protein
MCTRANQASVPDSLRALFGSAVSVMMALLLLTVALTTAPFRWSRQRPTKHGRPTYPSHVEVQVHLGDRRRVAEIELACHAALKRAARTWAPRRLPLDRVEVLYSAPPLGKVDLRALGQLLPTRTGCRARWWSSRWARQTSTGFTPDDRRLCRWAGRATCRRPLPAREREGAVGRRQSANWSPFRLPRGPTGSMRRCCKTT